MNDNIINLGDYRPDRSPEGLAALLRKLADALERDRPGPFGKAIIVLLSDGDCEGQERDKVGVWPLRFNCSYTDAVHALEAASLAYKLKILPKRVDLDP